MPSVPQEPLALRFEPLLRALPPVRLLLVALVLLAGFSCYTLAGVGLPSLLLLPAVAASVDLLFQRFRFERLRFPEAALVTGLFLALVLPPTAPLGPGAGLAVVAVGLRHAVRWRGRPIFNPAATGVLLGAVVFGMAPAWWASVSQPEELLLLVLGVLVTLRTVGAWRPLVVFLVTYSAVVSVFHALGGGTLSLRVLLLEAIDPSVAFFAFFMLAEPRTGPRDPDVRLFYGAMVAIGASLLPIVLPSIGILVALLVSNVAAFAIPARTTSPTPRPSAGGRASPRSHALPARWTAGRRAAAVLVLLIGLGAVAASPLTPHDIPPVPLVSSGAPPSTGGGGGVTAAACAQDNPSIAGGTLSMLHQRLGPSVILQYDASSGVTVFYDPVNQVTVTETDLFEDYGFAEFNGDDGAASGCVP